jgi:hypothetical protein
MNKINASFWALMAMGVVTFSACKKDENVNVTTENYKGIIVVNEGGFNKSNGSIGLYKPGTKTYFDAFKNANNRPLGDVVQSIASINDKFYIVVNNSNKIEVVNKSDFKSVASITTASPRYILPVSTSKAYVSNLYSNNLQVLDLNSNTVTSTIDLKHWSEGMAFMDGKAYVNANNNMVMVVNASSNAVVDSISTWSGLTKVVNAGSTQLGILCSGELDWSTGAVVKDAKFFIVSKDSNKVSKTINLTGAGYGGSLVYSSFNNAFYFSLGNNKVVEIAMDGTVKDFINLPSTVSVYGLSIDANDNIYVTDATDYNSAGKVYVYNSNGTKTNEFSAGIAPNGVLVNE